MDEARTGSTDSAVYRLIYRSRSRIPDEQRRVALGELFSQARSSNKKDGISGALLVHDDFFVQTLEGDEQLVQALLGRIKADPRHDSIEVLETSLVDARVFARWAMAKVASDDAPDIPLIAHTDGIARAAPRGDTTPEQEQVLSVMREAARGRPHAVAT